MALPLTLLTLINALINAIHYKVIIKKVIISKVIISNVNISIAVVSQNNKLQQLFQCSDS
jgi:hypothetical protein